MTDSTHTTRSNELVKVAYAGDQTEAEFLQSLLRDADVGSVLRRAPGFDVPEFLAAGPRDVLVAASDVSVARDVLGPVDRAEAEAPSRVRPDRPSRVLVGFLIVVAIVALAVCVGTGVLG